MVSGPRLVCISIRRGYPVLTATWNFCWIVGLPRVSTTSM